MAKKNFFVSYNGADRTWAEWIAWQLEEAGYTIVLQAWDFRPGSSFVLEMDRAAREAERIIAVLSPDYLDASFTQPEWASFFLRDPTGEEGLVVPVRVRECNVDGLLGPIIYIDLVGRTEGDARTELLAGFVRARARPKVPPAFPGPVERSVPERPNFPDGPPPLRGEAKPKPRRVSVPVKPGPAPVNDSPVKAEAESTNAPLTYTQCREVLDRLGQLFGLGVKYRNREVHPTATEVKAWEDNCEDEIKRLSVSAMYRFRTLDLFTTRVRGPKWIEIIDGKLQVLRKVMDEYDPDRQLESTWTKAGAEEAPSLEVSIRRCWIDSVEANKRGNSVLGVKVLFRLHGDRELQLASVILNFEGAAHEPLAMPTNLIQRDQTETFYFAVGGISAGQRLIKQGLDQGEAGGQWKTKQEWPKAYLHITAGSLDFDTDPFFAPTPSKPLAPDKEGSQT